MNNFILLVRWFQLTEEEPTFSLFQSPSPSPSFPSIELLSRFFVLKTWKGSRCGFVLEKEKRFQCKVFYYSSDLVEDSGSFVRSFLDHRHRLPFFLHQGLRGPVVPAEEVYLNPVKVKVFPQRRKSFTFQCEKWRSFTWRLVGFPFPSNIPSLLCCPSPETTSVWKKYPKYGRDGNIKRTKW